MSLFLKGTERERERLVERLKKPFFNRGSNTSPKQISGYIRETFKEQNHRVAVNYAIYVGHLGQVENLFFIYRNLTPLPHLVPIFCGL